MIPSPFDRLDYPSLRQSVYLNQASLGLIGQPAVTAMHTFIDQVARHGNLYMSDSDEVGYCEALRERSVSLANDARRYTQSTMSYASMAGLMVAVEQLLSLGEARIEEHARTLAAMLVSDASKYGWQPFRSLGDPAASPHIISLGHPRGSVQAVVESLRGHNIILCAVYVADEFGSRSPRTTTQVMSFARARSG